MLWLVLAALSAATAAAGIAGIVVPPRRRLAGRVRPYTVASRTTLGRGVELEPVVGTNLDAEHSLRSLLVGSARWLGQFVDRGSDDTLRRRLHQSRLEVTPDEYRMRVVGNAVGFFVVGAVIGGVFLRSPVLALVLGGCGLVFGATRWRGKLDHAIAERCERTKLELYTVNHLLAMHVRAGAGPVQAVQRIVARGHAIVVDELGQSLTWMERGVSEAEAFRHAAEITPEPSAARTYKLFAASAERGSDLGLALRALSEDLRDARREELRRLATRRRAAMLVPIIAVLAPEMLLFIAAPIPSMLFGSR